jgi:D-xylose transport system substrate-binding protein
VSTSAQLKEERMSETPIHGATVRRRPPSGGSRSTAATFAVLVCTVALVACGGGPADDGRGLTIGVSFPSQNQARWGFESRTMTEAATRNGDELLVNYANYSTAKQTSDVETMLQQDIDVLVLSPVDTTAAAPLVTKAQNLGVKVITYDAGVSAATADAAVERDNHEAGRLHAEAALAAVPSGNYAIIRGDRSTSVAQGMGRAYDEILLDRPGVNLVYDEWTPGWDSATAQRQAEAALQNNPDIDAFVVSWDDGAAGVVQALKAAGKAAEDVFVTGTDATIPSLAYIAQGWQDETVWTPIDQLATRAADVAHDLGTGAELPAPDDTVNGVRTYHLELTSVEQDNLCEFITDIAPAGWASTEQVFADDAPTCGAQ